MPIPDIFNPDMQSASSGQSFADDVVGRFRSGYQIAGRPQALTDWRITTGDPAVAEAIRSEMGGDEPQEWDCKGEDNLEVFTSSASVDIVIPSPSSIEARMLIWARGQKRIVTCSGDIYETEGAPYECSEGGYRNRREHEEQGHACEPNLSITFRLAANPDLGLFKFQSGAWSLASVIAKAIGKATDVYEDHDGAAIAASLALEEVEMKDGKKFTKPVLTILGPAKD